MILITGATGLVGSHLALQLIESDFSVCAMFRDEANKYRTKKVFELHKKAFLFDKINWVKADILDIPSLETAFNGIDIVYHCAALISFNANDEEKLRKTNIEGTANIVNLCLDKNIKRLCYVSSIAALGDLLPHEKSYSETTEWNPEKAHSDYAISKYGAEMEVFRGNQEGLSTLIVNPGVVLGPDFWQSGSGEIFRTIQNGLRFYTKGTTGFVAVSDLVNCMIQLTASEISGEKFIVVAENCNYKKLLSIIATALKVKKPTIYANKTMTIIGYKLDWLTSKIFNQKRKLTKQMAETLHGEDFYDNDKITQTLGFKFEQIETTITKICTYN